MNTKRISPLATRSLLAGLVMIGVAACQPVVKVPPAGGTKPAPVVVRPVTTPTTTAPTTPTTTAPTTPTTTAPTTPTTTAVPVTNGGWNLVGGDEFNQSALNTNSWKPYHNTYGDGNNELACLTPNNVATGGGTLKLTAKQEAVSCPGGKSRDYTSGFLGSRETGTYFPKFARFEIRAKVPHAQGLWPAFWLRHRNGASVAEVDIMEYFHSQVPGKTTQTLHLDGRSNISKKTMPFEAPTSSPGFHIWAVEISPDPAGVKFSFFLDGALTHTYVDTQYAWASAAPDAATWDIAINLAVGGKWVGVPNDRLGYLRDLNRCSIGGTAPGGCKSTGIQRVDWDASTYEIDYVRVLTRR